MKDLLPKISEAMNETFVGNYVFSDEELARIYNFTSCLLRNYDSGYGNSISQGYRPTYLCGYGKCCENLEI